MTTAYTESKYFSGQGVLLLAARDTAGEPTGFTPVGNVSELTIGIAVTDLEHKESQTGQRAIDLILTKDVNVTVKFTMESFNKENMALALYGTSNAVIAGSILVGAPEVVKGYVGKWTALTNIKIAAVVVKDSADTITYELGKNYEVNTEAGSIYIYPTATQTSLAAANNITDAEVLHVSYTFAAQDNIEAITSSSAPIRWARFEGLNTADSDKAMVVDIYKMQMKPLAELGLINEELDKMVVESKAVSDALRLTGSKFFGIRQIA